LQGKGERPSETLEWQPRYEWGKGKATTQARIDYFSMNLKGLATGIQRGGTGNARFSLLAAPHKIGVLN